MVDKSLGDARGPSPVTVAWQNSDTGATTFHGPPCALGHTLRRRSNLKCVSCDREQQKHRKRVKRAEKDSHTPAEASADPEGTERRIRQAPGGRPDTEVVCNATVAKTAAYDPRTRSVLQAVRARISRYPVRHGEPYRPGTEDPGKVL